VPRGAPTAATHSRRRATSDNGPFAETFPDTGYTPFRGAKGSAYEGGVRVPGIAYWKGTIKPGRVSGGLFDLCDLYATSLGLAGASDKVPGDRYIDSIDQSSLFVSDDGASHRRAIYYCAGNAFMGVRVPLKQPHGPVILSTVNKHLVTFKKYPPPVPMQ